MAALMTHPTPMTAPKVDPRTANRRAWIDPALSVLATFVAPVGVPTARRAAERAPDPHGLVEPRSRLLGRDADAGSVALDPTDVLDDLLKTSACTNRTIRFHCGQHSVEITNEIPPNLRPQR